MLKHTIKLNKKDLHSFIRYNLFHNIIIYFLIFSFSFLGFNLLKRQYPEIGKDLFISLVSIGGLFIILFTVYYLVTLLFSATTKDKKFLKEKTYIFHSDKLIIKINEATYPIKWKQFIKIVQNKKYYFLYISNNQAIIIPKRILNNKEKHTLYQILKKAKKLISKK